jgi:4-alpha-glucanotransferase
MNDDALDRLCRDVGVAAEYTDVWGRTRKASDATRVALLRALDVLHNADEAAAVLRSRDAAAWRRVAPPAAVFTEHASPYRLVLHFAADAADTTHRWTLALESGKGTTGEFRPRQLEPLAEREIDGVRYLRAAFDWRAPLPAGYHRFTLQRSDTGAEATTTLIVTPGCCYLPAELQAGARVWGPALQLYALRSARNWGAGDYTDLSAAIAQCSARGADAVGLNPLHALYPHNPSHASPYSPSSRLFLNTLYIDVTEVPDFNECAAAVELHGSPDFQAQLARLRGASLIDYAGVSAAKAAVMDLLYAHFRKQHLARSTPRAQAFRVFQANGGQRLRRHALFEALQEHFHREDPAVWGWPAWPAPYRDPGSGEVAQFAGSHGLHIEFYEYAQWQAELQLARAAADASAMAVGLYKDLAVSIDRGGAEAWACQDLYALGASVGAPPDAFNLKGQDWGLPPLRPDRLREAAYEPFVAMLRANMQHAGALRIDHVMGLARLFWIPEGGTAADGAYVHYPHDDLLGIVALESHRNRCLVIGEDLGTVPGDLREALARTNVLSYRLLYFEREQNGDFKAPAGYPQGALVACSTHDLPTLAGFWEGGDLALRAALALFPTEAMREELTLARADDRARLLRALEREGLLPPGMTTDPAAVPHMTPELALALHVFLARTPARVMMVQPEDVLGVAEQANLPGTTSEHPNWRRKLPLALEAWVENPRFKALGEALSKVRGRSRR